MLETIPISALYIQSSYSSIFHAPTLLFVTFYSTIHEDFATSLVYCSFSLEISITKPFACQYPDLLFLIIKSLVCSCSCTDFLLTKADSSCLSAQIAF